MGRAWVALLALATVVAGCASPAPETPRASDAPLTFTEDWVERALPNGEGHDHDDPLQHVGLSTPNFEVVGWDPLLTERMGAQAGGYFCGDLRSKEGRALAVVHSFTSDVAFVLVDVTDPVRPVKVGELVMERTHVWDVAMTPDQRFVVLATSQYGETDAAPTPPSARIAFRDACTGETTALAGPEAALPYKSGVVLVDIADLAAPRVADFLPLPATGGHSIVAADLEGETVILVTVINNAPLTSFYAFLGVTQGPLGPRFETLSIYDREPLDQAAAYARGTLDAGGHDGVLQVHPLTGRHVAYLADAWMGVLLLDITDPRSPQKIARWDGAASIANSDYLSHVTHSTLPIEGTWDGRHYTFVSEECAGRPEDTPSCLMYVLDTTDLRDPTLVGAWTIPVELGSWTYPGFSPHYMGIMDRTLFLAHWHAGLWAFDVSSPEKIRELAPIGVFVPDKDLGYEADAGAFGTGPEFLRANHDHFNERPVVADVLPYGDHVVVFDGTTGAYVLRFDATRPAPAPVPWPLLLPEATR